MIDRSLIRRYVAAVHRLAQQEGKVDVVRGQLMRLQEAVTADPRTLRVLGHPDIAAADKRALLLAVVGEAPAEIVRGLIDVVLEKERVEVLQGAADVFIELADEAAGVVRASIEVAWEPDEALRQRMQEGLTRLVGAPVVIDYHLRPELIGGARVHVGGRLIDGSLSGRLGQMLDQVQAAPYRQETSA